MILRRRYLFTVLLLAACVSFSATVDSVKPKEPTYSILDVGDYCSARFYRPADSGITGPFHDFDLFLEISGPVTGMQHYYVHDSILTIENYIFNADSFALSYIHRFSCEPGQYLRPSPRGCFWITTDQMLLHRTTIWATYLEKGQFRSQVLYADVWSSLEDLPEFAETRAMRELILLCGSSLPAPTYRFR